MTQTVYAVSEFTEILRGLIEDSLPSAWIAGEISNFARPASGHWYFTLKDSGSQLRCVMFRKSNYLVRPPPRDGDQVRVRAQASVYQARGELQLICEAMEPAGQGALLLAFERLKARLQAEGLFDVDRKRPIPQQPRAIGVITSATGAAVHDVLTALARRFPLTTVYLYPVPVQGADAAPAIVQALQRLPLLADVDVLLLVRGGGSLEDLWAFNEESVARAIRACIRPVIAGIGHEVDFSIADLAADLRAPTPTAAAELCSPNIDDWRRQIGSLRELLLRSWAQSRAQRQQRLDHASTRLRAQHPGRRLQDRAQRLDEMELRLVGHQQRRLQALVDRLGALRSRLLGRRPTAAIAALMEHRAALELRLARALQTRLAVQSNRVDQLEALLASFNPDAVLARGYAIARSGGRVLTDPADVAAGAVIDIQLAAGELRATRSA